jgi:hypothetical protein
VRGRQVALRHRLDLEAEGWQRETHRRRSLLAGGALATP